MNFKLINKQREVLSFERAYLGSALYMQISRNYLGLLGAAKHFFPKTRTPELYAALASEIAAKFGTSKACMIIDYGSDAFTHNELLIDALLGKSVRFEYLPVDCSAETIQNLQTKYPTLVIKPVHFNAAVQAFELPEQNMPKCFVFGTGILDSMQEYSRIALLRKLQSMVSEDDMIVPIFLNRKDDLTTEKAYKPGIKAAKLFASEALDMFNREYAANFRSNKFTPYVWYNPNKGLTSFELISTVKQKVALNGQEGKVVQFQKGERFTLLQYKTFLPSEMETLKLVSGFKATKQMANKGQNQYAIVWQKDPENLYLHDEFWFCACCNKTILPELLYLEKGDWKNPEKESVLAEMYGGYGSRFDLTTLMATICDDCIEQAIFKDTIDVIANEYTSAETIEEVWGKG